MLMRQIFWKNESETKRVAWFIQRQQQQLRVHQHFSHPRIKNTYNYK